jgi:hypothetical protein
MEVGPEEKTVKTECVFMFHLQNAKLEHEAGYCILQKRGRVKIIEYDYNKSKLN